MNSIETMKVLILKILVIIVIAAISTGNCRTSPKPKVLLPKNSVSPIAVNVSGIAYDYYPLVPDEPLILTTRGPGKLKIITRGHLISEHDKNLSYVVYYRINGSERIRADFIKVKADANSYFENSSLGFPTVSQDIIIELSRGEHTIELWSSSENLRVCARALFTYVRDQKINWVSMSPMFPNEPVSLVTEENVATYFRFTSDKPLTVRVTGPTMLRILNRIEFDYRMKGKINYRIEVTENKKVKNTYMLTADPSDVTRYRKNDKKTPGKANEIVVNVPSGTHTYQIIPLDNYSVLGRILFPKKDIKLGSD